MEHLIVLCLLLFIFDLKEFLVDLRLLEVRLFGSLYFLLYVKLVLQYGFAYFLSSVFMGLNEHIELVINDLSLFQEGLVIMLFAEKVYGHIRLECFELFVVELVLKGYSTHQVFHFLLGELLHLVGPVVNEGCLTSQLLAGEDVIGDASSVVAVRPSGQTCDRVHEEVAVGLVSVQVLGDRILDVLECILVEIGL
jgi:hypothetical protein